MPQQTGLQFTLTVEALESDTLSVIAFEGTETLSAGYEYRIDLASRDSHIPAEHVVDRNTVLTLWQGGVMQQRIHGIASAFGQGDTGHHHTRYHLTLVPALQRLSLRHNSRIFQQQSPPDIIACLLREMGINDVAFSLKRTCQPREYCVQYRETDLAFVQRLAAEEGMFYHFSQDNDKHTVIFSDDSQTLTALDTPVPYNAMSSGVSAVPFVRTFSQYAQIQPSVATLKEYSFKKPAYGFLHTQHGVEQDYQRPGYEHYDYPGRYKDDVNGKAFAAVRIEQLRRESNVASGESNVPPLLAGMKFNLQDHPSGDCNRDWTLVSLTHTGTQPQALEEAGGEGITSYNNTFVAIPGHRQWRASASHKPRVDGPQIAQVVGPEGEEIFCDEYGRVKVHFPWDRYSGTDEKASCWVRVSQGWAGGQYGMMTIPRIGHEVIVSFLDGDPDQPIITGRTYHALNLPPYPLPEHKTRTVLRTETHQGEGYNELRFEDQADKEEIYVHAQKDMNLLVENDRRDNINHDLHLDVEHDRFTHIKANDHLTVDGESRLHTQGDQTQITDGSLHMQQGKGLFVEAGNEVHLKAGSKIVLDAGAEITLKAGGSFVKIDGSSVSLVGPVINLNSGGSAGSGAGFNGNLPSLPGIVEQAIAILPVVPIQSMAIAQSFNALPRQCAQEKP